MGIDISKLSGALKGLAVKADTDKNNILEGAEISVFIKSAVHAGCAEECFSIMDQNKNDPEVAKFYSSHGIYDSMPKEAVSEDDYKAIFGADIKPHVQQTKSEAKIIARRNQIEQRRKELEDIHYDDIERELGKNLTEKLSWYLDEGKIGGGMCFNLSKLSDDIVNLIGADYLVTRSNEDYVHISEMTVIKEFFGQELSDKEIKKILKFCGVEREGVEREAKKIFATTADAALFNIPSFIGKALKNLASKHEKSQAKFDTPQDINAAWAALVETNVDEKTCNALFDSLHYLLQDSLGDSVDTDKYKEYIENRVKNENNRNAIYNLVDCYKKTYGDDWYKEYGNKLNDLAGSGSTLSPEELAASKFSQ